MSRYAKSLFKHPAFSLSTFQDSFSCRRKCKSVRLQKSYSFFVQTTLCSTTISYTHHHFSTKLMLITTQHLFIASQLVYRYSSVKKMQEWDFVYLPGTFTFMSSLPCLHSFGLPSLHLLSLIPSPHPAFWHFQFVHTQGEPGNEANIFFRLFKHLMTTRHPSLQKQFSKPFSCSCARLNSQLTQS